MNMRKCDGCGVFSSEDDQDSCCSSHVDLSDFGIEELSHFDDMFFCSKCLNKEGFCKKCDNAIPDNIQVRIGLYLDTNDSKYKIK